MTKRVARHDISTGTARHGLVRHGTMRHGRLVVTCLLVPPGRCAGPGTSLSGISHAVPCHWARRPSSAHAGTGTISDQHFKLIRITKSECSESQTDQNQRVTQTDQNHKLIRIKELIKESKSHKVTCSENLSKTQSHIITQTQQRIQASRRRIQPSPLVGAPVPQWL